MFDREGIDKFTGNDQTNKKNNGIKTSTVCHQFGDQLLKIHS